MPLRQKGPRDLLQFLTPRKTTTNQRKRKKNNKKKIFIPAYTDKTEWI